MYHLIRRTIAAAAVGVALAAGLVGSAHAVPVAFSATATLAADSLTIPAVAGDVIWLEVTVDDAQVPSPNGAGWAFIGLADLWVNGGLVFSGAFGHILQGALPDHFQLGLFTPEGWQFGMGFFGIDPSIAWPAGANVLADPASLVALNRTGFVGEFSPVGQRTISNDARLVASMPEPATLTLLGAGLIGLAALRRCRAA